MKNYSSFAQVYDLLMSDVNYKARTQYILKLFKKFGKEPTLLLDVACGTGAFSNLFAKKGIDVIGVDMSEDMLAVARENSAEMGTNVLFLCQKAEELDLYGTVDGAVCCLDSLNHITDKRKLATALKKISLFLEPDCLFIFDINTPYKHEKILENNTFAFEQNEVFCVWQNQYNPKKRLIKINLDFFVKTQDSYERSSEEFFERAYTCEELEKLLFSAGFKIEGVFDDMSETPLKPDSQRAIYVCRKL